MVRHKAGKVVYFWATMDLKTLVTSLDFSLLGMGSTVLSRSLSVKGDLNINLMTRSWIDLGLTHSWIFFSSKEKSL